MPNTNAGAGVGGFLQGFNSVVGPYIERQSHLNQQSQASQVVLLKKQAQKRLEEIDNAGQMDQFKADPNFQKLVQFAYGVDTKAPGTEILTFLASPGPSTEQKLTHGIESAKKAAGIFGAEQQAPSLPAMPQSNGTPSDATMQQVADNQAPAATAQGAQYGPPSINVTSKGNASVTLTPLNPTQIAKKNEGEFWQKVAEKQRDGMPWQQALDETISASGNKAPATVIADQYKRAAAPAQKQAEAAASTTGRLGVEAGPLGEAAAAARGRGALDAQLTQVPGGDITLGGAVAYNRALNSKRASTLVDYTSPIPRQQRALVIDPQTGKPVAPGTSPAEADKLGAVTVTAPQLKAHQDIAGPALEFVRNMDRIQSKLFNTDDVTTAGKNALRYAKRAALGQDANVQDLDNIHNNILILLRTLNERGNIRGDIIDRAGRTALGGGRIPYYETQTSGKSKVRFFKGLVKAALEASGVPLSPQDRKALRDAEDLGPNAYVLNQQDQPAAASAAPAGALAAPAGPSTAEEYLQGLGQP